MPHQIIMHIFQHLKFVKTYKQNPKYVRINVSNDAALESFVTEVSTASIYEKVDTNLLSDPTQNYNIIEKPILEAKEKHLPSKIMRFNKYRHKISPWITNGILASIRHRDKPYYQKSQIPTADANYHILESNLKMYNRVLNKAIRKAKRDYYQNMLTKYKHDLKKMWSTLNTLLCRNKKNKAYPDRINTGAKIITNTQDIATYFNSFFSSNGHKLATSIRQTPAHDYKK